MTLLGVFIFIAIGFFIGWFARGGFVKSRLFDKEMEYQIEEFQTKIDAERAKQHRMLEERINS